MSMDMATDSGRMPRASYPLGGESPIARPDAAKWYLLLAQPQEERSAAAHLIGRRFRTYLPTLAGTTTRGVRRAKVTVQRPMFPGYLFIRLDLREGTDDRGRLHFVTATPGIRKFLHIDGHYAVIPDFELARVEQVERDESGAYLRRTTPVSWNKGEKVRVAEGLFVGKNAEVLSQLDDGERIEVLMSLLRRSVKVTLPATALEKL